MSEIAAYLPTNLDNREKHIHTVKNLQRGLTVRDGHYLSAPPPQNPPAYRVLKDNPARFLYGTGHRPPSVE